MSTIETSVTDNYGDVLEITSAQYDKGELLYDEGELLYFSVDNSDGFEFTEDQAREVRDALNEYLGEEPDAEFDLDDPNTAKLQLAAALGLKAKFAYQGDLDRKPVERRLVPVLVREGVNGQYVEGESFDAGGISEGYRQFRLDRISGEVVVR